MRHVLCCLALVLLDGCSQPTAASVLDTNPSDGLLLARSAGDCEGVRVDMVKEAKGRAARIRHSTPDEEAARLDRTIARRGAMQRESRAVKVDEEVADLERRAVKPPPTETLEDLCRKEISRDVQNRKYVRAAQARM